MLRAVSLIGRQHQLESVRGWVAELAEGRGRAVLVEGEPGIGKTSLLRVAADEARASGCRVFWAACDELSRSFPLLPLVDALDGRYPVGDPDAGERRTVDRHAGDGARRSVTDLLRQDSAPGNRVDMVAAAAERLLALLDEYCTAAPTILFVDDLLWADLATVMTLSRLARSVPQLPLLLVCTTRPVPLRDDLGALRRALEPDAVLSLSALSGDDATELIARKAGGRPGSCLMRLAEGAAGNPLYLTELVDALIRGRALVETDGWVEARDEWVPGSLGAAIADRLEFLSIPGRDVLRAAALLGADFSVSDIAVVSGRRVGELLPFLNEAIAAGVLLNHGSQLVFRHPLIRDALYEAMAPAVRAAWHRDAARALAEAGATAERVARQLLPASESEDTTGPTDEWVARWLSDAGRQLVDQAPDAAVRLLRWVLNGVPQPAATAHDLLTCRLADALFRTGDAAGAAEVATAALRRITRPDLLVDLHWTLTQCRAVDGTSEQALDALGRALEAPRVEPRHRARLLVLSARAQRNLGRVGAGGRLADRALEEATAAGDRWATGWALGVKTLVHGMRGETSTALPLFDRALAVADGDPALADLRLMLQINQAVTLGDLDRHEAAISAAEQVRQLADQSGNVVRLTQAQSVLGELFFDVGRWDDALAEVEPAATISENPVVQCCDHGVAAVIQLHRGQAEAAVHLADAEEYASRLGDRVIGSLALAKSLDREQAEAPDEALALLMDGLAETAEEVEQTTVLLADAARLAIAVGDEHIASDIVRRAEAVSQASDVPHRLAVAPHCRGLLERDATPLLEAADHYLAAGRPLPRAQALEAAGVALAEQGDIPAARARFTDAFSLYAELGADWDVARTQAKFRAYGIRRGPHVRHRRSQRGWASLTPTELKVVALVASGMSNPQIAAHLFLSRRTVQTHVSHILAKLNLNSRIDIAREASMRELGAVTDVDTMPLN